MIILRQKEYTKIKMDCPATKEELNNIDKLRKDYYSKYPRVFDGPVRGTNSKEFKALRKAETELHKKYPEYFGQE